MTQPLSADTGRRKPGPKPRPPEERKGWTLVEIREHCRVTLADCWEWRFPLGQERPMKSLGHFGQSLSARQAAYLLMYGKLPPNDLALSPAKCKNAKCINPTHCRPTTISEKLLIASARGTLVTPERTRNMTAAKRARSDVMNMEKARAIRATSGPAHEHAPQFGISPRYFNMIRSGKAWREEGAR